MFLGDGAVRQGSLHETFNLAMLWKLPVIFIVENNGYAMGTSVERTANHTEIWKLGLGYEMLSKAIDGMDPVVVMNEVNEAVQRARKGHGPHFWKLKPIVIKDTPCQMPSITEQKEVQEYQKIDPINTTLDIIMKKKYATEEEIEAINNEGKNTIAAAVKLQRNHPFLASKISTIAFTNKVILHLLKNKQWQK